MPWIKPNQKGIDPADLPQREIKLEIFATAIEGFLGSDYVQVGMDHFALRTDELARAAARGQLYRNFMGYTVMPATDQLGLGVSAIGDVRDAFAQNTKKLPHYYAAIDSGRSVLKATVESAIGIEPRNRTAPDATDRGEITSNKNLVVALHRH